MMIGPGSRARWCGGFVKGFVYVTSSSLSECLGQVLLQPDLSLAVRVRARRAVILHAARGLNLLVLLVPFCHVFWHPIPRCGTGLADHVKKGIAPAIGVVGCLCQIVRFEVFLNPKTRFQVRYPQPSASLRCRSSCPSCPTSSSRAPRTSRARRGRTPGHRCRRASRPTRTSRTPLSRTS